MSKVRCGVRFFVAIMVLGVLLGNARVVYAHTMDLSVLSITQQRAPDGIGFRYALAFSHNSSQSYRQSDLLFPAGCRPLAAERLRLSGKVTKLTWGMYCDQNLLGNKVQFQLQPPDNLAVVYTSLNGDRWHVDVTGDYAITLMAPEIKPLLPTASSGFVLMGVEHILLGADHLLFVFGLLFLFGWGKALLLAITGFTVGHSLTLLWASLMGARLPVATIEIMIALSLVYLASCIVQKHNGKEPFIYRYPLMVAATFGLFHGLGFARAIIELDIEALDLLSTVLLFNVGVELAQLLVVAACLPLLLMVYNPGHRAYIIPVAILGVTSGFWFWVRVADFLGMASV
jgi:hypothetical protein